MFMDSAFLNGNDVEGLSCAIVWRTSSTPSPADSRDLDVERLRTPFDWLSRDPSVVDAFIGDPLCFTDLQPDSAASFLATAPTLATPARLQNIPTDLPLYLSPVAMTQSDSNSKVFVSLLSDTAKRVSMRSLTISIQVEGMKC